MSSFFFQLSSNGSYFGDVAEEPSLESDEEESLSLLSSLSSMFTSNVHPRPFDFATAEVVQAPSQLELAGLDLDVLVFCNFFGLSAAFAFAAMGGAIITVH